MQYDSKKATLGFHTDESLSVSSNDLDYLTREEAEQIIERFKQIPQSYDRLLFWTGIPRKWVQQWADDHGMLTFTSAMGPLMDSTDQRCLRRVKKQKKWSKYVKGASGIFARYACRRGIVRVLTLPPSWAEFIRPGSTYRTIEEPVLKGTLGCCCAVQINTVHLLTTPEELEYQTWPENRIPERLSSRGASSFSFRLPSWTQTAVNTAAKSLRSNVVSLTALTTPKLAGASVVLQGSVKRAGEPPTAKQPKDGKQLGSNANAQGSLQSQSQQPQSKKQQPQSQQLQSKKQQPQSQQLQSKKQQPQSRQSQSKSQQPQSRLPQSKKQQPQGQQSSSKTQQPQSQQPQSKKQQPQSQQRQSQQLQPQSQQPQSQQLQSKKQQSQIRQPLSKEQSQGQQPQPQAQSQQPQRKKQLPRSNKPQRQSSKQAQQSEQPQSSKKLKVKVGT